MGIYLFNRDVLVELLKTTDYEDFGKQVFPTSIAARHVQVHLFDGYWEDIGTIRAFYEANLALTSPNPPFEFAAEDAPIYSRTRSLPPTRIDGATIVGSLLADGCVIGEGSVIENSVVGLRCRIGRNVTVRNSVLMGADYYQSPDEIAADVARPPVGIGAGSRLQGVIVDKNCRIRQNVRVQCESGTTADSERSPVVVRDGVVVVPKATTLPVGWSL